MSSNIHHNINEYSEKLNETYALWLQNKAERAKLEAEMYQLRLALRAEIEKETSVEHSRRMTIHDIKTHLDSHNFNK